MSIGRFLVRAAGFSALIASFAIPGLNIAVIGSLTAKGLLATAGLAAVAATQNRRTLAGRQGSIISNAVSEKVPLPVVYGTQRLGVTWAELRLDPSDSKILYAVGAICVGSEAGTGIQDVDAIRFDDAVAINNPTVDGTFGTAGVDSAYTGKLSYSVHLGTNTQAVDAQLNTVFPTQWPSTSKGAGIAYIVLKLTHDTTVFPVGLPNVTCDVKGQKLFDPRTSTTAFSVNPALMVRDYLTSTKYGAGVLAADIDDTGLEVEADYCDATINTTAYNGARFIAGGIVDTGSPRAAALADIASACRGQIIHQGGTYRLYITKVETPTTFALNESNIVGDWEFMRVGDVPNSVRHSYVDPGNRYQVRERQWPAPSAANAFLTADNNVAREVAIDLPFTPNRYIAEQIAMVALREAREDLVVGLTAKQEALKLQIGDVVPLTHSTPGFTAKPFRVAAMGILQNATVRLILREYDAGAYTLDTQATIADPPGSSLPDPFERQWINIYDTGVITHTLMAPDAIEADNVNIPALSDIAPDMGTIIAGLLNNAASNPTAGVRLDSGSTKPGTWVRYLDLAALTTAPFLVAGGVTVLADGTTTLAGDVIITDGSQLRLVDSSAATALTMEAVSADEAEIRWSKNAVGLIRFETVNPGGTGWISNLVFDATADIFIQAPNVYLGSIGGGDTARVPGNLAVSGQAGFFGTTPVSKPTVTGSRGGNAALASLLTALANLGLITDSTT